jgi:carboxyl-terminal processing protease
MQKTIFLFIFIIITLFSKNIKVDASEQLFFDKQKHSNSKQNSISWTTAFDNLHAVLTEEYAFTAWKQIDWPALYLKYRPRIAAAETANDTISYFLALRGYVYSIPDGHMECLANSPESWDLIMNLMDEQIGGSYGFALIGLDDGRVVTSIITNNGPASNAGMRVGAEVLEWNGKPINSALEEVSELWGFNPSATNEIRRLRQYRFIGRDLVGAEASIKFKNPSETSTISATITAINDNLETYWLTHFFPSQEDFKERVKYEILESGYGFIKVTSEGLSNEISLWVMNKFKEAIEYFVNQNVQAVILAFRRNAGGFDEVAAYMAGFFYNQPAHYEYITYYNQTTKNFEITATINIEPISPHFSGKVVVMVGPGGISSGEGPAMAIQKLPQGQVISFYASNGSFGMAAGNYDMPCNFTVTYTNGQSLDINKVIQVDGDASGNGGVIPDIRVPLDDETVYQSFVEGEDVELNFVIEKLKQLTKIEDDERTSNIRIELQQNYPNPFNPSTTIEFDLPKTSVVNLKIYNILGEEVATLVSDRLNAGNYSYEWSRPAGMASGVYLYRLEAGDYIETRKMVFMK